MNPTKDYIAHEGRIGVPDPAFPFPKLQPPDLHGEWKDDKYKKAFDAALLHTAWFADEEQAAARMYLPQSAFENRPSNLVHGRINKLVTPLIDGPYTVPDMPEWEKQWQCRLHGSNVWDDSFCDANQRARFKDNGFEYREVVRFMKEKEPKQENKNIMRSPHLGQPVIYQQSDGKGGMIYFFAIIVKILPDSQAVNLKIFSQDNKGIDCNYDGIQPVDLNETIPARMQSNRWNLIESQS